MFKRVKIVACPVTERYIRPGDYGDLDPNTNRIRVNGVWFNVTTNWIYDFEPLRENEQRRFIICAANYYNDGATYPHSPKNIEFGFVTCGRRHHNCISTFSQIYGFPYSDEVNKIRSTEIQGFLTSDNFFVDRKLAYIIAHAAEQIIGPNKGRISDPKDPILLTSEDLY